jgi:hypothetical protein
VSDDWKKSEATFEDDLHAIGDELLDQRSELFYPRSDFFDTRLHLNAHGRELRTDKLIEALREKLKLN